MIKKLTKMSTYFSSSSTLIEDSSLLTEQLAEGINREFPLSGCNVLISCTFFINEQELIEKLYKTLFLKIKHIFSSSILFDNITEDNFIASYLFMNNASYEDVIDDCNNHLVNSIGIQKRFAYFGATFNNNFASKPLLVLNGINKISNYLKKITDCASANLLTNKKKYSIMISPFKPKTKMHFVEMNGVIFYCDYLTEILLTLSSEPKYMLNEFGLKIKRIENSKNMSEENRKIANRALIYGDVNQNDTDFYMEPIEIDYRRVIDICWTMIPWVFNPNFRIILQSSMSNEVISPDVLREVLKNCNERIPAIMTFCMTSEKTEFGIYPLTNVMTESGTVIDSDLKIYKIAARKMRPFKVVI